MQDRVPYEFAVIRVVPKVEREEFMNIGVILYSKRKKYLGIKYHVDDSKLKAFSEKIDVDLIKKYLHAWELVCKGGKEGGPIGQQEMAVRFRWLSAPRSTIIQSSSIHPGICTDPQAVLEDLFQLYVL
jgi:hypothetical protein